MHLFGFLKVNSSEKIMEYLVFSDIRDKQFVQTCWSPDTLSYGHLKPCKYGERIAFTLFNSFKSVEVEMHFATNIYLVPIVESPPLSKDIED